MGEQHGSIFEIPMNNQDSQTHAYSTLTTEWTKKTADLFRASRNRDKILLLLIVLQFICLSVAVASIVHFYEPHGSKGVKGSPGDLGAIMEKSARQEGQIQQLTKNISDLSSAHRQFDLLVKTVGCEVGWEMFMNSCYYFELESVKTWKDAKIDCHSKGGYLVKIDNAVENCFLKSYLQNDNVWIGATDNEQESNFVWESDNTSLTFTDWNPNEPNNAAPGEDCASMGKRWDYRWNDWACSLLFSYICEKHSELG
ncbi:collectin-11-like [Mytilus trossulus]|uniref:collectin-11-like n=1 Tax=Mytilus trossulus TaxID=6551 RepID=UPI003006E4E3